MSNNRLESIEDREARLNKQEGKLRLMEDQLRREGENLGRQAEDRVKKQLEEISKRELALAPKETKLKDLEGSLSTQSSLVGERERTVAKKELSLIESERQFSERERNLRKGEESLKTSMDLHRRAVEAEKLSISGQNEQLTRLQKLHDAQNEQVLADIRHREEELKASEERVSRESSALANLKSVTEATCKSAEDSRTAREKSLLIREQEFQSRMTDLGNRERATNSQAEENIKRMAQLDAHDQGLKVLERGLSKAKVDIEVKELELEKREKKVAALIKKNSLLEEAKV